MRSVVTLIGVVVIVGLMAVPAAALNTYYGQENVAGKDGYMAVDGTLSGRSQTDPANSTANWKYQYGVSAWSGVYSWDGMAWITETESGDNDGKLEIECDIELYVAESLANNKVYFHIGNLYDALTHADTALTAYVTGTFKANHGCWIGISFPGKLDTQFERDGEGKYTGKITDAMVGSIDLAGRDISTEKFDVRILLSYTGTGSSGGYVPPDTQGEGAHGTIQDALWWLVNNKLPGSYDLSYKIELLPEAHQADGNYELDPVMVIAPVL